MPSRLVGDKDSGPSTFAGVCAAYILTAVLSTTFSSPASALQTVPGSPCADQCTRNDLSYANNTVCLDEDYQTGSGQQFRECTTCLLNSTAVDTAANVSDVYWGLCKSGRELEMKIAKLEQSTCDTLLENACLPIPPRSCRYRALAKSHANDFSLE